MHNEVYTCENGIAMQDIDAGVEYSYNGRTLSLQGEYSNGEVHLNDDFIGYYNTDNDGVTTVTHTDGRVFVFEGEEGCEDFAKQMLTA